MHQNAGNMHSQNLLGKRACKIISFYIKMTIFKIILRNIDMCGVEGKRRLCDLNVTSSSPALATRHIRNVLLVNSPNKLNLLSWLLIYLCNK